MFNGYTNIYMMVGALIAIGVVMIVFAVFFFRMGFFESLSIIRKAIPSFHYYYKNYTKDYHTIIPLYAQITQLINCNFKLSNLHAQQLAYLASFFYDNPTTL